MGFNIYLGLLVESTTSISTILLIDVDVESSFPYIPIATCVMLGAIFLYMTSTLDHSQAVGVH